MTDKWLTKNQTKMLINDKINDKIDDWYMTDNFWDIWLINNKINEKWLMNDKINCDNDKICD